MNIEALLTPGQIGDQRLVGPQVANGGLCLMPFEPRVAACVARPREHRGSIRYGNAIVHRIAAVLP
jgi:hypothetical protein